METEELTPFDVIRLHDNCSRDSCMEKYDNPETPTPCPFFTREDVANPDEPMAFAREYIVYPSNYNEIGYADRHMWCIYVIHTGWGWAIKDGSGGQGHTLTKKGEWLYESRGHKQNKSRRFTFEEAMRRAKIAVDKRTIMGSTAAQSMDPMREGWDVQIRTECARGTVTLTDHKLEKVVRAEDLDDGKMPPVLALRVDSGEEFPFGQMIRINGRKFFEKHGAHGGRKLLGTKRGFEVAFGE